MRATILQAGESLAVQAEPGWVADLLTEALSGAPTPPGASRGPGRIDVVITRDRAPFPTAGWDHLTRGCRSRRGRVVMANAAGSGFDLRVGVDGGDLTVEARWRPPVADRLASRLLAARARLLTRAVLTQYPALWWAGCRGRVPLHASAVTTGDQTPLLAGPGGAGRSTVLLAALARGGRTTGDNLAVTDGESIFGVTEPCKVVGATGRRTSHGRRESALAGRVDALAPDRIVLLQRSAAGTQSLRALDPVDAAAALTAATYMAGELRRYWGFAATLTLGTGRGPAHPPLHEMATRLASRLPAAVLNLGPRPPDDLAVALEPSTTLGVIA